LGRSPEGTYRSPTAYASLIPPSSAGSTPVTGPNPESWGADMHTASSFAYRIEVGSGDPRSYGPSTAYPLTAFPMARREARGEPRPELAWPLRRRIRRSCVASCITACLWVSLAGCGAGNALSNATKLANLTDTRVTESSGLATSLRYPNALTGILWTHNDSGNPPYLFATDRTGAARACFEVDNATNVDWEDIAEGPGAGGNSLYIGDFGDNDGVRTDLAIYRVAEPDVAAAPAYPAIGHTLPADRIPFTYPGGARYDAETLLVNAITGEGFVVTKESSGTSRVFQFPAPLQTLSAGVSVALTQVATVRFRGLLEISRTATGGDISPDGMRIVIRTYTQAREWTINAGQSVADALTSNHARTFLLPFGQGESVCYRPDGFALLFTSEQTPCPLYELPIP
jgi:hypothetical protein